MRSTTSCRVSISWCFVFKASRPPAPPHACHRDGGRQWRSYPHNGQPEAPQTGRTTRWCRTRRRRPSRPKTLPAFTGPMRRTPAIVAARTTPERPHPALMSVCKNLRAPVKTGEVLRMKEPDGEGLSARGAWTLRSKTPSTRGNILDGNWEIPRLSAKADRVGKSKDNHR